MIEGHRLPDYASTGGVPWRSFIADVVVGTVLNRINQGDALLAGWHLDGMKIALTCIVPYCVTTYGAVSFRLSAEPAAERLR